MYLFEFIMIYTNLTTFPLHFPLHPLDSYLKLNPILYRCFPTNINDKIILYRDMCYYHQL